MILIVSRVLFSFPGSKMPGTIAYMSPAHGKEEIDLNCLSCPWLFGTRKEDRPWPRTVFSSKTVPEIPAQLVFKQIELMIRLLFKKSLYYFGNYNSISMTQSLHISRPPLFSLLFRRKASRGGELFNIWMIEKLLRQYHFRCNLRNTTSFWSQQEKYSHSMSHCYLKGNLIIANDPYSEVSGSHK